MRNVPVRGLILALAVSFAATPAWADRTLGTDRHKVRTETVVKGLEHPWGLALLPDGRFLVTERNSGQLRIGSRDGTLSKPVAGVPKVFRYEGSTGRSQAGLFDVKLDPGFAENRRVYLSLSKPSERGTGTAVVRGRLVEQGSEARLDGVETVFEMKPEDQDSSGLHFGGRMAFDPEGRHLYLTIGERRNISRAQDANDQAGSIVRIGLDGAAPSDNPFVGEEGKDDKIFSWGHRNPQGLAFEPGTGRLWANDHGPLGGDEINLIEAGNNYGWPFITGGRDYSGAPLGEGTSKPGMTSAVHIFSETIGPSGLAFYAGDQFPEWQGDMLHGGLAAKALVRVRVNGERVVQEELMLRDLDRRIRDVQVAGDGAVWLLTEHADGEVIRLSRAD